MAISHWSFPNEYTETNHSPLHYNEQLKNCDNLHTIQHSQHAIFKAIVFWHHVAYLLIRLTPYTHYK